MNLMKWSKILFWVGWTVVAVVGVMSQDWRLTATTFVICAVNALLWYLIQRLERKDE